MVGVHPTGRVCKVEKGKGGQTDVNRLPRVNGGTFLIWVSIRERGVPGNHGTKMARGNVEGKESKKDWKPGT